jgi:hypothetical protein
MTHGYRVDPPRVVDVDIFSQGSQVIAQDVYVGGDRSIFKHNLGSHKTPGHAQAFVAIMNDPRLFVAMALGELTQEHFDKVAEALNERMAQSRTDSGDTVHPS